MIFREATIHDIEQIQFVRHAVKENLLSNPALVTDTDCEIYMTVRGKAWVCALGKQILGFAYVDMQEYNIWALFVLPEHAEKGIGKKLHKIMLDWYFDQTDHTVWLGTDPKTRAETFYRKQGWTEAGIHGREIKFEMTAENWRSRSTAISR